MSSASILPSENKHVKRGPIPSFITGLNKRFGSRTLPTNAKQVAPAGTASKENDDEIFVWPPLWHSRVRNNHHRGQVYFKWFFPMFLAGCGFVLQNFQLRIATYNYVHLMTEYEVPLWEGSSNKTPLNGTNSILLSVGLHTGDKLRDIGFGALDDPLALMIAPTPKIVKIGLLDMMAAAFPALFFVLAIAQDQLGVWTRIFYCFALLAFGKGLFGWMTIVPASDGWDACQARLDASKYNADWYSQKQSYFQLFTNTLTDPTGRLCADMLWSGHTYFVTIFALGLYELSGNTVRNKPPKVQTQIQSVVGLICCLQQACEIYFVILSRFHYTMDVVLAIVMTFLLYTNTFIAVLAKDWVNRGTVWQDEGFTGIKDIFRKGKLEKKTLYHTLNSNGDLFIPGCLGCCTAPCMTHPVHGNQHIYTSEDIQDIFELAKQENGKVLELLTAQQIDTLRRQMKIPVLASMSAA